MSASSPEAGAVSGFDVCGICAHPDDAELVMGGLLAIEAARGRKVALVDLTRGECGSRGTPEGRERESREAAAILGASHRESLGLPDSRLTVVPEQKDVIVAALRRLQPRVVVLQHWEQRHPDHASASRLVYESCFLSGLRNYRPDLGLAFRPFKLVYALGITEPVETAVSFLVDVSAVWDQKMKAVRAYASQFTPAPGETVVLPFERFQQTIEVSARRLGQRIGVEYAEGYVVREPLHCDDLSTLRGRSI